MRLRSKALVMGVVLGILGAAALWLGPRVYDRFAGITKTSRPPGYAGSLSCRPCHEEFYRRWEPSHHGRAMQPFTAELMKELSPRSEDIVIGDQRYRAELTGSGGWIVERGPQGEKRYRMEQALGGKNVFYFLTALEKGRLQTLPVAYDVARRQWFDTSASGLRHFSDVREERVFWREYPYTFNSSCYGCHVSQMSTNYNPQTDSYSTVWAEPGINCETCHGPGEEHIRAAERKPKDTPLAEPKIIRIKTDLTVEQKNATCAPCHAKMSPITSSFRPGDRFFDHFDLVTLESPDFYADGRDLGENYTETQWLMNPCAQSGQLDCIHCHTSSGRYRFQDEAHANEACMPCHANKVHNATAHSRHAEQSRGNRCISCHMPMTEFARMRRSDHSFRPPAPSATIAFKSPNACNLCHADKSVAWADRWVRQWRSRDYQAPILKRGRLIAAARSQDWSQLSEMLDFIAGKERDEVFANSLIRLLRFCNDPRKLPAFAKALEDPSPLIRASAVDALGDDVRQENMHSIASAASDNFRLVRVRAGSVLARVSPESLTPEIRSRAEKAIHEYLASLTARADDYSSQYNLGNYHMQKGELLRAVDCFERALGFEPRFVQAMVNSSLAYNALGRNEQALVNLRRAVEVEPKSVPAQLNLGLLLAEMGRKEEAQTAFRRVLEVDPGSAAAAHNLGILLAKKNLDEAITWCRKAFDLLPGGKYGFTLAFYLQQKGDIDGAIRVLRKTIDKEPGYADAYHLLAELYSRQGRPGDASAVMQALQRLSKRQP